MSVSAQRTGSLRLPIRFYKGVTTMTVKYLKDFYGTTAKLTVHNDGTATLKVSYEKKLRHYKNEKSAMSAWYRWSN